MDIVILMAAGFGGLFPLVWLLMVLSGTQNRAERKATWANPFLWGMHIVIFPLVVVGYAFFHQTTVSSLDPLAAVELGAAMPFVISRLMDRKGTVGSVEPKANVEPS